MAAAPAYASAGPAHDYLLAHLCRSYSAAAKAELPRVLELRAAMQKAARERDAHFPAFVPPSVLHGADLSAVSAVDSRLLRPEPDQGSVTLRWLRDTVQPHAPPSLG